jgi:hypothetical protein
LLQALWSTWRLRPSSVSFGTMDRQFDCTEQSPQPSQTASLMNSRDRRIFQLALAAPAALLCRAGLLVNDDRRARHSRSSRCSASISSRWCSVRPSIAGRWPRHCPGSSLTRAMRRTPSPPSWRSRSGMARDPSMGWPPVMATASL